MIDHLLIFAFPPEMPADDEDRFFAEIRDLMLGKGGATSFEHHANLLTSGDDHAPVFKATAIARIGFTDLDAVAAASALPELGEFIGAWQSRYPYGVVWANEEVEAPATSA